MTATAARTRTGLLLEEVDLVLGDGDAQVTALDAVTMAVAPCCSEPAMNDHATLPAKMNVTNSEPLRPAPSPVSRVSTTPSTIACTSGRSTDHSSPKVARRYCT